jgi:hypothetical protein
MRAVKTKLTTGNLAPPEGQEDKIDDLPFELRDTEIGQVICSVWVPSDDERRAIAEGQNIELGVGNIGIFPPVSLGVTSATEIEMEEANA